MCLGNLVYSLLAETAGFRKTLFFSPLQIEINSLFMVLYMKNI